MTRLGELQYGIIFTTVIVIVSLYVANLLTILTFIKTLFCFYSYSFLGNTKADNYRQTIRELLSVYKSLG